MIRSSFCSVGDSNINQLRVNKIGSCGGKKTRKFFRQIGFLVFFLVSSWAFVFVNPIS